MVAYSFKGRFREPILAGSKRQTIRADRKRHARVGEEVQLYTGMRTAYCRLIGRAKCVYAGAIRLDLDQRRVELASGTAITTAEDTDAFAQSDGFADWKALAHFWRTEHPGLDQFSGIMIRWTDLVPAELELTP